MVNDLRFQKATWFLAVITAYSLNMPPVHCQTQPSALMMKPQNTFNIAQYGAVADSKTMCTEAIQKAIDACANAGGGRVVVPAGTFLTSTIILKSRVNLHLEDKAVLLGSPWFKDYPPQKPKEHRRDERYLLTSLIFAQGVHDISVTGKGTLNGNSQAENDFMNDGRIAKHRPCLIWFDECTNVLVKDVTFTSSGFWTETYTLCRNVHVDGITVTDSDFRNNDGCNVVDCDNFLVENCDINALDDGICLKGYTPRGCNNVVIRNNRVRSTCNGIKAGTDSSGGFRNILIENNEVYQTGISGIALELVDGGVMENVIVRNIKMDVVGTPIFIKLGDRNRPVYVDGVETKVPVGILRDVKISGIHATVDKANKLNDQQKQFHNFGPFASSITGIPGYLVENVCINNVDIEILGGFPIRTAEDAQRRIEENSTKYPENRMFGVLPAYGFYIRHAKNIKMNNIRVAIRQKDARSAFVLDDVHDSLFHDIRTENVTTTSPFFVHPNCTKVDVKMKKSGDVPAVR
ncbi:MAG: hypothetical protein A2Z25_20855 [Planctomycetes bacterium RBG_16_55_9]|nr:MAG: hypothetical protein A2Z25_20855 [Planctomycetes bacterium RBG_16_55_9]